MIDPLPKHNILVHIYLAHNIALHAFQCLYVTLQNMLILSSLTCLCLAAGVLAERSFTSACVDADMSVVSADQYSSSYAAVYMLTRSEVEVAGNYWITPNGVAGHFVLDLGCSVPVSGIELVNTHNAGSRTRSTRGFTVSFSASSTGPWSAAVSGELEDSRQQQDPLPLQTFTFSALAARFVKFQMTSYYGSSGGLQYFNVLLGKSGTFLNGGSHIYSHNHNAIVRCSLQ